MMRASLRLKIECVLTVGTVFGISLLFPVLLRFRAWHLGDKVFSSPSKRRSHRPEQEC